MGKIDTNLKAAKSNLPEEEEDEIEDPQQLNPTKSPIELSSSTDDEEANEDLSLKIVQKAMLRACVAAQPKAEDSAVTVGVVDLTSSPSQEAGASAVAAADVKSKKKSRKEKKNKNKMVELAEETVVVAKEEEKADSRNPLEIIKVEVANPAEISDNIVLRKLLRGPRYFDPPDSGWGTCYNCGEEGHTTVNCTSAKRKKPCFVCGSLEHNAKQCTKGQDCFICNRGGHRAKECPEKYKRRSQNSKICLKCGDTAHDMFSCKNDYSPDDLKEIQCYICKSFGHLCCADFTDTGPSELSCYRCGQLGHGGMECTRSHGEAVSVGSLTSCFKCGGGGHFARECTSSAKECARSNGEAVSVGSLTSCFKCGGGGHFARECTSSARECTRSAGEAVGVGSLTSCFKCGEEGHFARECTGSAKVHKRKFELSTSTKKSPKKNRDTVRARSVSSEPGKAGKRKKAQYEGGFTTPSKSKRRGGWITKDPGELPYEKPMRRGWESPVTPIRRGGWITEDPGDLPYGKAKVCRWESPVTPTSRSQTYASVGGSQASSSRYSRKTQKLHFGASAASASVSNGSFNFYQHQYSASRFGNSSSDGMRRNFDW